MVAAIHLPPAEHAADVKKACPDRYPSTSTKAIVGNGPPVIDLSQDETSLVKAVREACITWGFFQIVGHGVPKNVREEFEDQMRAFFQLSEESKMALERSASNARGYVKTEMTKGQRDHKECFDIGNMVWSEPCNAPINQGLNGTNRLPGEATLPGFRNAVIAYFKEMEKVATTVSELMALGMGAPRTYFQDAMASAHSSHLRLNHYPALAESDRATKPLGVGPHTDASFLTVLAQDINVQTLQVKDRSTGAWVPCRPVDGAFTINTGDLAVIFSNNIYQAPEHRVLTHTKERYSAPYFYNPSYEATIAPVSQLVTHERPTQFWPMLWGYFRAQRVMNNFNSVGEYVKADMWRVRPDGKKPRHVKLQEKFSENIDFRVPFDILDYQRKFEALEEIQ